MFRPSKLKVALPELYRQGFAAAKEGEKWEAEASSESSVGDEEGVARGPGTSSTLALLYLVEMHLIAARQLKISREIPACRSTTQAACE